MLSPLSTPTSDSVTLAGALDQPDFAFLAETDEDPIFVLSHELRYLYLNPAAERVLRKDRNEIIGRLLLDVYPEAEFSSSFYEPMVQALWEQIPITTEGKLFVADLWFEIRIHPFDSAKPLWFSGEKEARGLIIYCRDITRRKQDEEEARRRERLWHDMADALPQMICASDPHGNIQFTNQLFTEYTGFTGRQTLPQICQEIVHPDDVASCSESLAQAMTEGQLWQHEHRLRRISDGQYRWHLIRCTPRHDAKGEVTGWFGVATDIHLRREAEEALQTVEKRLALAVEASEAGIFEIDCVTGEKLYSLLTFRLLGISCPLRLTSGGGHPVGTVPFASVDASEFWKRVHPEDHETVKTALRIACDPGSGANGVYEAQYRVIHPDGGLRWIMSKGRVTFDSSGGLPLKMIGLLRDVTETRQAYEEQSRVSEALQRTLLLAPAPHAYPGVTISAFCRSAHPNVLVGGDFFDVFVINEDVIAFIVGDATGKGVEAAAHTAEIKFALRGFLHEHKGNLIAAMQMLNTFVTENKQLDASYNTSPFTALAAVLFDKRTKSVSSCCAGAESPLILRTTGEVEKMCAFGPLLGVEPDVQYVTSHYDLNCGDLIVMTTDGITEARSARAQGKEGETVGGEFFGVEGLAASLRELLADTTRSLSEVQQAVVAKALHHAGGQQRDDICLLIAKVE